MVFIKLTRMSNLRTARNGPQMRLLNRLRMLRLVRRGAIARSEIAVETGLTRAAISLIVSELIGDGLLLEAGCRGSAGGRRPVLLELNPEYAYALGLTISRTGAEVGVVDFRGQLLLQTSLNGPLTSRGAALLEIKQAIRRTLGSRRLANRRSLGLGISTPGPVDVLTGTILNPPNFDLWHGVRLCDELMDVAGQRVFLANNSQALTMAEKAYGRGRDCRTFILLVVESGIGAGIVCGEDLYSGWSGFGNEVGHTSINYDGPKCKCGLRGCVELYASVPNVLERVRKDRPRIKTWQDFIDSAHSGETSCRRVLQDQARALATALVNAMNTLELDAIVLTGDVLYRGELLREMIEQEVNQSAINRRLRHIPVCLSALEEHSAVMAAAGIAIEKFFQGEPAPTETPRLSGRGSSAGRYSSAVAGR